MQSRYCYPLVISWCIVISLFFDYILHFIHLLHTFFSEVNDKKNFELHAMVNRIMDPSITSVARCTYKNSTNAFYIRMDSSFVGICCKINSLFDDVDLSARLLKYSLNGGAKFNLESDRDIQMMLMSKTVSKVDFIDIEVVNNSATALPNVNDESDTGMQLCNP